MITEDYVSFEVAKLLKEKGFNEYCRTYYTNYRIGFSEIYNSPQLIDNKSLFEMGLGLSAPTHQMVMKWLRKKHIIIVISPECLNIETHCSDWGVEIWWDDNYEEMSETYLTFEDACGAAIKHVLENLN